MSISSLGVGSGLDLESLVSQLIAAERGPKEARLDEREERFDNEISALGRVTSSLSAFEDALADLQDVDSLNGREPQIENPSESNEPFTATPGNQAVTGNYDIAITQLARGSRIETADAAFSSSDDVVLSSGTADLTFKIGNTGDEFTVSVEVGTTLEELRQQINDNPDNFGVSANIINTGTEAGGSKLVFTSDVSGEGNDLSIVNTNNVAELNALSTTDSSETSTYLSPILSAQDAVATVDGINVQSATNSFENTIQNVSFDALELSDLDANGEAIASRLTIGFDNEGLRENIDTFVEKYNELIDELDEVSSFGITDEDEDGALAGDSLVRGIQSGLATILGNNVEGSVIGSLFSLGIELTTDGRLEVGSTNIGAGTGATRLDDALTNNFDDIANLFSSENGIATRLTSFTEQYTQPSGLIASRETSIETQQSGLEDERESFELRMESLESTLRARFLSLDSTIAGLQSTGNALFAAIGNL